MLPWEHLAVGYLLYSLGVRAAGRRPPSEWEAVVLVFATQIPDLIDKPLSWGLGWFPTGHAIGHSAFVALPVGLLCLLVAHRTKRLRLGVAFVVGYWSHLLGDVANALRSGGPVTFDLLLWPVVVGAPYDADRGLGRGVLYLEEFLAELWTTDPLTVFVAYILLPLAMLALWVRDGAPGTTLVSQFLNGAHRRL